VWDIFDNFFEAANITAIPREENHKADNLAKSVVSLKPPNWNHLSYSFRKKQKLAVPYNIKQWQVFKDDEKRKRFRKMMDKYTNMNINSDGSEDEYKLDTG